MDFFDKLGKKATEAYKITADKTGKIAKETKLKFKMSELKSQIEEIYEEIGKKVYEKHIREEEICIKKDLEEECTKIDILASEIEDLQNQTLSLKDKKQCQNCYTEIDKEDKYCKNCGAKQDDIKEEKIEEIEDVEEVEKVENNYYNNEEGTENTQKVEYDEYIEKSEEEKLENDEQTNLEKTVETESK